VVTNYTYAVAVRIAYNHHQLWVSKQRVVEATVSGSAWTVASVTTVNVMMQDTIMLLSMYARMKSVFAERLADTTTLSRLNLGALACRQLVRQAAKESGVYSYGFLSHWTFGEPIVCSHIDWRSERRHFDHFVRCVVSICSYSLWPPLWSNGQSSWLQIQRPGFDSRHYQKKISGSGTGSTQPREYNWGATW
jgi:hypothetical protein